MAVVFTIVAYILVGSLVLFGHMCYWRKDRIYDEDFYFIGCIAVWVLWPAYVVCIVPFIALYRLFKFLDEKSKQIANSR